MPGGTSAIGIQGSNSASQWRDWGWVFGSGETPLRCNSSNNGYPDKVLVLLNKSQALNEITGTIQLPRVLTHCGLTIELSGIAKVIDGTFEINLIPQSSVSCRFSESKRGIVMTSPAFKKYSFVLKLPEISIPPTLNVGGVAKMEYKLIVSMEKADGSIVILHEKMIFYQGQLTINMDPLLKGNVSKEVTMDSVKALLELPRKEYLLKEEIPFTIKLLDNRRMGVKKVTVTLLSRISAGKAGQEEKENTQILDCLTFKRFLKREMCTRNGKFGAVKTKLPSFYRNDELIIMRIQYEIMIQITSFAYKTATERIGITIGTHVFVPTLLSPDLEQSPPEESPSSAEMEDLSLASSMLSLCMLPPEYSQLPSRSNSIISIETLPPHYDDVQTPST